jgi:hypothetical protein
MFDKKTAAGKRDTIFSIALNPSHPQGLGCIAKHGTTIQPLPIALNRKTFHSYILFAREVLSKTKQKKFKCLK